VAGETACPSPGGTELDNEMKRSRKVEIALVAGLAMSGCGRRAYDPCNPQTFNEAACQDAVNHNGYFFDGQWYPHTYSGSYSAYYVGYHNYVLRGGSVTTVPPDDWTRPKKPAVPPSGTTTDSTGGSTSGSTADSTTGSKTGAASSESSESSVSRGVFGSSAHGSSSGSSGGGESGGE
jgi:hypothetical protein